MARAVTGEICRLEFPIPALSDSARYIQCLK